MSFDICSFTLVLLIAPPEAVSKPGVKKYFIEVQKRVPTPTCTKLTSPVVAVQAEGDYVTVLAVRMYKYADDPSQSYTSTWFDTWRFVDGKADEHSQVIGVSGNLSARWGATRGASARLWLALVAWGAAWGVLAPHLARIQPGRAMLLGAVLAPPFAWWLAKSGTSHSGLGRR